MPQIDKTKDSKPSSVAETLQRAKALIEDPSRWIKGAFAKPNKNAADWFTHGAHPKAGAWCMLGAVERVDGPFEVEAKRTLAKAISGFEWIDGVSEYNDAPHRRHRDVLKKFDKAIALAEKEATS